MADTIVMSIVVGLLVAWDGYVSLYHDMPNPFGIERGLFRRIGARVVAVPFICGVGFGGHFCALSDSHHSWVGTLAVGAMAACFSAFHFFVRRTEFRPPAWFVFIYLVLGIPFGAVLWPL